ncbi:MAG: tRNA-dihydrouridine synthase [Candidatus Nomurabacteria bacterium GW2011_GWA2_40_9]|uniref:tRNA-dihydrouridine synthase n=1 Tax=Candidatus Nomurabacteria bacterium GW2011_GWA2_40_9 TaxID=1618734 RepID=A0A0G0WVK7_9BACT|nr:MAG: tRNA-dihydrouridine synthase [Candidatus Nomurabacteria bacterium GW2011_GWA2_40_9]
MKNFWENIHKPFFVLAPMADVTDCAFRQIMAKYGKPDVFWTEFVSADGLAHPVAREKLLIDLKYGENEHPIVAQIFGGKPENIKSASKLCKELGFDGVDINMGCPDKSIGKQCAGAAMMKDLNLARKVIQAAKEGAGSLPISIKTRIGYNKNEINTWIRALLEQDIAVLTVHLRTRKEMSDVPAHWEVMRDIVKMRDELGKETLIIGNGDAIDVDDARKKCEETGCDGVMFGRAIFGNPWLFSQKYPLVSQKLKVLVEHTKLFEKILGGHKNFAIMKKHYKAYVNGFDGTKELRVKLMETKNAKEVESVILNFLK